MKKLMSNKDYHAHEAKGSTTFKKIALTTLLHAMSEEVKETEALQLGSAVHAAILEPETFDAEFAFAPKVDKRTKAGKEEWAKFADENAGKTILKQEHRDVINGIVRSLNSHEIAKGMLSGGEAEYSYFVKDEETGVELKCRPDYVNHGALIDLKTCQDASEAGFTKACINFGYHIQAAFYLDVYNKANGTDLTEFFFVAVETKPPFAINTFKMGEVEIQLGREMYKKALKEYAEFKKDEKQELSKFGYIKRVNEINFPLWALERHEVA